MIPVLGWKTVRVYIKSLLRYTLLLALVALSLPAAADQIMVNAVASGWYTSLGDSNAAGLNVGNYLVAKFGSEEFRNFFVFDLTAVPTPIVSPSSLDLIIPMNGVYAPNPLEYTVFSVDTAIAELVSASAPAAIFADLGTGIVLGSTTVRESDSGTVLVVPLNQAGIALLNQSAGGLFAIGGAVTNFQESDFAYAFAMTNNGEVGVLNLDPPAPSVPEPASLLMIGSGLLAGAGWMRKRIIP